MRKKVFLFLVIFVIVLFLIGLYRTLTFETATKLINNESEALFETNEEAVLHLKNAISHKTVSNKDYQKTDFKQYEEFISFLKETYPLVFKKLEYVPVNKYGILLIWRSEAKSNKLPLLITGHYDTVGVDESAVKNWSCEPFGGEVVDNKIMGRGVLDDKASFTAIFEAIDSLLKSDFTPKGDIYFAFGQDEETGGVNGAKKIAEYLNSLNIKFEAVLDEGGRLEEKNGRKYAYVGISEKGRYAANIIVKQKGGHASRPASVTSVTKAADVIKALNENQMKGELTNEVKEYYKKTFFEYDFLTRYLIANSDVLTPLLIKRLSKLSPIDNAYLRNTTAFTILKGSETSNVIPDSVSITGDFRLLPNNGAKDVEEHIEKTIGKIAEYELDVFFDEPASNVSKTNSSGFNKLESSIKDVFNNAIIVPYMVTGGTDAKHYEILSDSVYRFLPIIVTEAEYALMHNTDEYVTVENYNRMIAFYKNLISNFHK